MQSKSLNVVHLNVRSSTKFTWFSPQHFSHYMQYSSYFTCIMRKIFASLNLLALPSYALILSWKMTIYSLLTKFPKPPEVQDLAHKSSSFLICRPVLSICSYLLENLQQLIWFRFFKYSH